jgi:lipid II:glycine glycyltransferase (peptidoglycan interpeptide bridge formation enzyme)
MIELIKENLSINQAIPVFATEAYLQAKSDNYGWFKSEDFLLPFTIASKSIFKRLIFTSETIYLQKDKSVEDEKSFLNAVVNLCKKDKLCDVIYKAQANAVFNTYPDKSEFVEWATYESALDTTLEDLFAQFRSKDRTKIRKMMKWGVSVHQTNQIDKVHENIKATFERQNNFLYPSLTYLKKLQQNLPNNVAFFVVEHEHRIQGTAVIIYDSERAFYFYGGSSFRPVNGSINLLHYKILDFCYQKGIAYYDLMGARTCVERGSKFEAIQKFKSTFGMNLKKGYAFRVVIKPIRFTLFSLLVQGYFKLKKSDYLDPIDSIKRCHEKNTPNL